MKILITLSLLIISGFSFGHGGHMSTQKLTFTHDKIELEFKIDVKTIDHFSQELFGEEFKRKKGFFLTRYINENLEVIIDNSEVSFELVSIHQNEDYLVVQLEASHAVANGEAIKIVSNLFYEQDAQFENRIVINDSGSEASFRLDKAHNSIITKLNGQ